MHSRGPALPVTSLRHLLTFSLSACTPRERNKGHGAKVNTHAQPENAIKPLKSKISKDTIPLILHNITLLHNITILY